MGKAKITVDGFVEYCDLPVVRLIFSGSKFNFPIMSDTSLEHYSILFTSIVVSGLILSGLVLCRTALCHM